MNSSPGSQTGSIVMLAMTVVITAVGIALVLPLIDGENRPSLPTAAVTSQSPQTPVVKDYSEFYPQHSGGQRTVVASQRVTHRSGQSGFRAEADGQPQPAVLQPQHSAYVAQSGRVNRQQFFAGSRMTQQTESQTAWERQQVTLQPERRTTQSTSVAPLSTPVATTSDEPLPFPDTDILYNELAASAPTTVTSPPAEPAVTAPAFEAPDIRPAAGPQNTVQPPVVQTSVPQTPVVTGVPLYAPTQVPAGSVYAPVTVNFDAAAISDQIRLLQQRIDQVAEQKVSNVTQPGPIQPGPIQLVLPEQITTLSQQLAQNASRKDRQRDRGDKQARIEQRAQELANQKLQEQQRVLQAQQQAQEQARMLAEQRARQREHSQQLARIGQGMDTLTREMQSLQQHTQASMATASAHKQHAKATADAAAEVIEGYRRELAMERQRANTERELRQEDAIRLAQREAALLREASRFTPPESVPAPRSSGGIVKPREMTTAPADSPAPLKISREVPVNENAKASTPPVEAKQTSSSSDGMNTKVLPATKTQPPLPFPPFESQPVPTQSAPLQLPSPDAKPQAAHTAAPVSFTKQLSNNAKRSVGFSNTYKFSMEVDQNGHNKVVQTAGPDSKAGSSRQVTATKPIGRVCPKCGKIHPVNQPHNTSPQQVVQAAAKDTSGNQKNVRQTALQNSAPQTSAAQAHTAHRPPASYTAPTRGNIPREATRTELRRNTRNAGRGMRKMGTAENKKPSADDSEAPRFLQLRTSTLTEEPDEPSILHRMSSTLRQFGRSVQ
ncbi:MAG: hypothetical protein NXI04_29130 [Planctomycetaceae bacterium]|nr:hypothetical protein [Planctomycetaceae bacterium]